MTLIATPETRVVYEQAKHAQPAPPAFVIARSGRVHEFHCFALTHDGTCDCPFVLATYPPRRRTKLIS